MRKVVYACCSRVALSVLWVPAKICMLPLAACQSTLLNPRCVPFTCRCCWTRGPPMPPRQGPRRCTTSCQTTAGWLGVVACNLLSLTDLLQAMTA